MGLTSLGFRARLSLTADPQPTAEGPELEREQLTRDRYFIEESKLLLPSMNHQEFKIPDHFI